MAIKFHSNLQNVQQDVCIDRSKFQDGKNAQTITVAYRNGSVYNYEYRGVDEKGNYCFRMMQALAGGFRRKKRSAPSCPSICIVGTGADLNPTIPCSGTTQALQAGNAPSGYSNQLTASGGTSPYTYVLLSGELPPDLTIDSSGLIGISISPEAETRIYTFTAQATDANGCTGTQEFTIEVTSI